VVGSIANLDAGRPLRIVGCHDVFLPAGRSRVIAPPGRVFRPNLLALSSPAPRGDPPIRPPGTVLDVGRGGDGRRSGVELRLTEPGWLVLAESWSDGWRAWCEDAQGRERGLGRPEPIDAYAAGWRVGPDCRRARFAFVPQRIADVSYLLSLGAALVLAGVLVGALTRRRRAVMPARAPAESGPDPPDPRLRPSRGVAVTAAALIGLAAWLWFSPGVGIALGAAALLLSQVGVTSRRLYALGGAGLLAVPVLYLVDPATELIGSFNSFYAQEHIEAHWVASAAVAFVLAGSLLDLVALRRAGRGAR
jgi:hypothetical protein